MRNCCFLTGPYGNIFYYASGYGGENRRIGYNGIVNDAGAVATTATSQIYFFNNTIYNIICKYDCGVQSYNEAKKASRFSFYNLWISCAVHARHAGFNTITTATMPPRSSPTMGSGHTNWQEPPIPPSGRLRWISD